MHLKMLSALRDDWLPHSDPFSAFGDMEAEIAELKTMTRVTKLRRQIECKEEGAWMVVRDVPDERVKGGTRKVTSYGRASRSVTRSVSGDLDFDSFLLGMPRSRKPPEPEVVVEYPDEEPTPEPPRIHIEEIEEKPEEKETSPIKKTSIVTLGKGNMVLIDDEDSNFRVTGISKGKVADAVSTLERISSTDKTDKKVKKVGFCKTEIHFAPDSGRVNIVETDEKPPPTQILRKKKRPRNVVKKSNLPKLYFGDEKEEKEGLKITEHLFPVIREPSPLLSTSVTSLTNEKLGGTKTDVNPSPRISSSSPELRLFDKDLSNERKPSPISYLGNVSPKLNKLIQNSLQHEFQLKQQKIMKKHQNQAINIKLGKDENEAKSITQLNVSLQDEDTTNERTEPLYVNKDIKGEEKREVKKIEDKAPKPKPRTSITKISVSPKETLRTKPLEKLPRKVTPKPREVKKEIPIKPVKPYSRSITPKQSEPVRKIKVKTEITNGSHKLQKLIKNTTEKAEGRSKKSKEPLRSFEKVSNGWVGHCIVPIKNPPKSDPLVTTSNTSLQTGIKRSTIETKGTRSSKTTLSSNKQFSLSKEHLKSAKLVKELSKEKEGRRPDIPRSKVNVVRPHTVESRTALKGRSIVSRRRLQYEESQGRLRRDSDLSDDSVVRADEEVRAYMFHTRHKVHLSGAGINPVEDSPSQLVPNGLHSSSHSHGAAQLAINKH